MLGERVKPRKGYSKVITKLELLHDGRARDAQRRRGRRMTRHEVGGRWCPPPPFTIHHHTYYRSTEEVFIRCSTTVQQYRKAGNASALSSNEGAQRLLDHITLVVTWI